MPNFIECLRDQLNHPDTNKAAVELYKQAKENAVKRGNKDGAKAVGGAEYADEFEKLIEPMLMGVDLTNDETFEAIKDHCWNWSPSEIDKNIDGEEYFFCAEAQKMIHNVLEDYRLKQQCRAVYEACSNYANDVMSKLVDLVDDAVKVANPTEKHPFPHINIDSNKYAKTLEGLSKTKQTRVQNLVKQFNVASRMAYDVNHNAAKVSYADQLKNVKANFHQNSQLFAKDKDPDAQRFVKGVKAILKTVKLALTTGLKSANSFWKSQKEIDKATRHIKLDVYAKKNNKPSR